MADPLYAINPTGPALTLLPTLPPNYMTYTMRQQPTNGTILDMAQNFTGQDQAILYIIARGHSLGGYSSTYSVDMRIENATFLSGGSASALVIPAVGASAASFAPPWSADLEDPPIWATGGYMLSALGAKVSDLQVVVDICMIPASQLPLLGG